MEKLLFILAIIGIPAFLYFCLSKLRDYDKGVLESLEGFKRKARSAFTIEELLEIRTELSEFAGKHCALREHGNVARDVFSFLEGRLLEARRNERKKIPSGVPTEDEVLRAIYESGLHQYIPGVVSKEPFKHGAYVNVPSTYLMLFVKKLYERGL